MKKLLLLLIIISNLSGKAQTNNVYPYYNIPQKEINCFKHFNHNQQPGRNKINTYLLSKLSQLVYSERLDFELKKLKNPTNFPPSNFNSKNLNSINNSNFEVDFTKRFSHWFYDINSKPIRPVPVNQNLIPSTKLANNKILNNKNEITNNNINIKQREKTQMLNDDKINIPNNKIDLANNTKKQPTAIEKFITDSIAFEKTKPKFKFLNKSQDFASIQLADNEVRIPGFDPEVMVVSTEDYIIITWRGTDNIYKEDNWEWVGTDFYFVPVPGDEPLNDAKLHAGMWTSFKIIKDKLMNTLNIFEAKTKNKKIFITGHSLGGGMALISAPYLAGKGYNIAGVYSFAAPRVIGDQQYVNKCNSLLGKQKIQRFEYGVDPITKIWSPALYFSSYKIPGVRNWWSADPNSTNEEFYDTNEREYPMTYNPVEYLQYSEMKIERLNGDMGNLASFLLYVKDAEKGNTERPKDVRGFTLVDFGQHNPTYYTLKAYQVLSDNDKAKLPKPESTYPYVMPGVNNNK